MKFLVENLETITADELVKVIPHLKDFFNTGDLSRHSSIITKLLASLKIKHTYDFMKAIDENYPGLSFHFIMEGRHSASKEGIILLYRIAYYLNFFPEQKIFQPMRERLIRGLLEDSPTNENELLSFNANLKKLNNVFFAVDNLELLSKKQKNKIKTSIFEKYLAQIIETKFQEPEELEAI